MNRGLIILGVLLLIGGLYLGFGLYIEVIDPLTGRIIRYEFPFLSYGFALAIIGIGVTVLGLALPEKVKTPPITRLCPQCGRVLTAEMHFCPDCGKKLG